MTIDVYTITGTKKGTATLPTELFEAPVNEGLMHQALVRQQNNRRHAIAHVKSRGEVRGSTAKLFRQKGTGRARRGSVRAPLLRGGGKAFGPRNKASYAKDMPRKMRRQALFSGLSLQAKNKSVVGLEGMPTEVKTKKLSDMLSKMPVEIGRRILVVLPEVNVQMMLSLRNIPNVKVVTAQYLNVEDVLNAKYIVFHVDALKVAEDTFVASGAKVTKKTEKSDAPASKKKTTATEASVKKSTAKKESSTKSDA